MEISVAVLITQQAWIGLCFQRSEWTAGTYMKLVDESLKEVHLPTLIALLSLALIDFLLTSRVQVPSQPNFSFIVTLDHGVHRIPSMPTTGASWLSPQWTQPLADRDIFECLVEAMCCSHTCSRCWGKFSVRCCPGKAQRGSWVQAGLVWPGIICTAITSRIFSNYTYKLLNKLVGFFFFFKECFHLWPFDPFCCCMSRLESYI